MPEEFKMTEQERKQRDWDMYKGGNYGGPSIHHYKDRSKFRCRASVHDGGRSVGFHQCHGVASFQDEDGIHWCGIHSPPAVRRRHQKQQARWDAESAARRARNLAHQAQQNAAERLKVDHAAFKAALESIRDGHNDPRTLAAETLAVANAR